MCYLWQAGEGESDLCPGVLGLRHQIGVELDPVRRIE